MTANRVGDAVKVLLCMCFVLLLPIRVFADELPRLEVKHEISLSNKDSDRVALWFHCSKWNTAKENYHWQLVISRNGEMIKRAPIGISDGPLDTGFSAGMDNTFAGVPVGQYSVVAELGDLRTNTVSVKVVKE